MLLIKWEKYTKDWKEDKSKPKIVKNEQLLNTKLNSTLLFNEL
ncbi:hypothetical protein SATRI_v1c05020 [Spiroplasma atrichopogonis]|nr:hypothetical protein SATRI_v1c05020 [Spiroplasma atrichopogonis]